MGQDFDSWKKTPAFVEKQIAILYLLCWSKVLPLKQLLSTSLPWQPATLRRIRSSPQLTATFSFILMGGNSASGRITSRMAGRKSARQRASPSSFEGKASERRSPWLRGTRRARAGGGSPRWWQVHKAWQHHQVTSASTAADSVFWAMELGSKGKSSASAKLGSFFTPCEALVSGCAMLGKDTIRPTNSRDWLPPIYVNEAQQVQADIRG